MMKTAQWVALAGAVLALLMLPWWAAARFYQADKVVWECHMAFEVTHISPEQALVRSMGNYSQFFYGGGSGIARLSGRNERPSDGVTAVSNVHRFIEFDYKQAGPYLKKDITHVSRRKGDTLSSDQYMAFSSVQGDEEYVQVFKLGPSTYAFGGLGMPGQVCEGRQGWLTPRVR